MQCSWPETKRLCNATAAKAWRRKDLNDSNRLDTLQIGLCWCWCAACYCSRRGHPCCSARWKWKPYSTACRIGKAWNYEMGDIVSWALRLKHCQLSDIARTTGSDRPMGQLASEGGWEDREIEGVCWEPKGGIGTKLGSGWTEVWMPLPQSDTEANPFVFAYICIRI